MNGHRGKGARGRPPLGRARFALVALGISLAVVTAACAERPSETASAPTTPVATTIPTESASSETPSPREQKADRTQPPSPSESATVDPYALADGVYPAYVRDVDVAGRTVTADVVQTFEGWRARQAALEDGLAPWKARRYKYYPVYIRDENPLLRTLPVSEDATIVFMGECEETTHGVAGLRELADRSLPYSTDWYYTLTVRDEVVQRIEQHIAISAC